MITSKDIFAKRKAGELDEAYRMALQRMGAADINEWDGRAFGWCLIDLIKRDVKTGVRSNLDHYRQQLEAIVAPESDDVLTKQRQYAISLCNPCGYRANEAKQLSKAGKHDRAAVIYRELLQVAPSDQEFSVSLGWELYRISKALLDKDAASLRQIKQNLNEYLKLHVEKPSLLHSVMLQIAAKLAGDAQFNMAAFCRLWNLEFLRSDDWERFKTDDGKQLPSLSEKVIQQASKEAAKSNDQGVQDYILQYLDRAISEYPDNIWLSLNKAKVLLALNRNNDALKFALEVARAKSGDYWVWELLGDICLSEDPTLGISCYCKALLCSSAERFSIKVRVKLAAILIDKGHFPEAKYEIGRILGIKQEKGNKVPPEIDNQTRQSWFASAPLLTSNKEFYRGQVAAAESLLFSQLPWIAANLGEGFSIPGKEDKLKRKLYLKADSEAIEVIIPESKFNFSGAEVGSAIRVKGDWDAQKRFQVYLIDNRRSEEKWDIFLERIGVVDNVNYKKQLIHFLVDQSIDGVVPFSDLNAEYNEGDSILVRLSKYMTREGVRYRVLSAKKSNSAAPPSLRKEFRELVRINDSALGFTSTDIFIPPNLVKIHNLKNEQLVEGVALLNLNKKRNHWGWKAVDVQVVKQVRE